MNSNEKRWVILLVAVVVIAIIFFVVITNINKGDENSQNNVTQQQSVQNTSNEEFTTELDDGTKINTSESFGQTKTYNNLEISNIQFTSKDGKRDVYKRQTYNSASAKGIYSIKSNRRDNSRGWICNI